MFQIYPQIHHHGAVDGVAKSALAALLEAKATERSHNLKVHIP
ncbi:hypothetical protein [Halopseudomonas sp.]